MPESPKEAQDPIFLSDNEQVENNSTKKNISSSTLTMKRKLQELNQDIPQKLKLKKKDCTAQPTAMLIKSIDNAFEKLNQLLMFSLPGKFQKSWKILIIRLGLP